MLPRDREQEPSGEWNPPESQCNGTGLKCITHVTFFALRLLTSAEPKRASKRVVVQKAASADCGDFPLRLQRLRIPVGVYP